MNNVIHCSSIYYIYGEVITRKLGLDRLLQPSKCLHQKYKDLLVQ